MRARMDTKVYHETIDGRKVAYVALAYGLGRASKLVIKQGTLSRCVWSPLLLLEPRGR